MFATSERVRPCSGGARAVGRRVRLSARRRRNRDRRGPRSCSSPRGPCTRTSSARSRRSCGGTGRLLTERDIGYQTGADLAADPAWRASGRSDARTWRRRCPSRRAPSVTSVSRRTCAGRARDAPQAGDPERGGDVLQPHADYLAGMVDVRRELPKPSITPARLGFGRPFLILDERDVDRRVGSLIALRIRSEVGDGRCLRYGYLCLLVPQECHARHESVVAIRAGRSAQPNLRYTARAGRPAATASPGLYLRAALATLGRLGHLVVLL